MPPRRKSLQDLGPGTLANHAAEIVKRSREPKAAGVLRGPSRWLSKEQKIIWRKLVKYSPAALGESDRPLLEIAVVLKAKLEAATIENAQITQLLNVLSKLGMIPKERQATEAGSGKVKDEWDEVDA
jgi:phage terminase small subunit